MEEQISLMPDMAQINKMSYYELNSTHYHIPCMDCEKLVRIKAVSLRVGGFSGRCRSCITKRLGWRGKNNPHWKGGKHIKKEGYVEVYALGHPFVHSNGYVYEHRLVAAEEWGIFAVMGMHVHHKNGDRADNRIENLELVEPRKHQSLHNRSPNSKRRKIDEPNPTVYCFCGCGSEFLKYDKKGRSRRYLHNHHHWNKPK